MRRHMMLRTAALTSLLAVAGCALDEPETVDADTAALAEPAAPVCPTASERWPLSRFWWKTTRQLERFVWTSDGARLLGSELVFEERRSWDPLDGTTRKRRFCHQLFLANPDGSGRQDLGGRAPLQAGELFAFPSAGYVVAQTLREGAWDYVRVGLDGSRRALATLGGDCVWGRAVPSPTGDRIAVVRTTQACNDGGVASTTEVSFLDGGGAPLPGAARVELAGLGVATWTPAGDLVVTDQQTAVAVGPGGGVRPAPVPGCTEPPTSSSDIDARGRVVGVDERGRPVILETDPARAFGCQ
jgi:hypothetical protein